MLFAISELVYYCHRPFCRQPTSDENTRGVNKCCAVFSGPWLACSSLVMVSLLDYIASCAILYFRGEAALIKGHSKLAAHISLCVLQIDKKSRFFVRSCNPITTPTTDRIHAFSIAIIKSKSLSLACV